MNHHPNPRFLRLLLGLALALPAPCQAVAADQDRDIRATMQSVAALIEDGHVLQHAIDDSVSERAFQALFEELDPQHMVFLQADIDALAGERDRLDDYLRAGDDRFALRVEQLFETRLRDAADRALHWLAEDVDFTRDESYSTDVKTRGYAKSAAELDELWRLRVKLDRLALQFDKIDPAQIRQRLQRRYEKMASEHATPQEATTRFLEAIAGTYDPHTTYFSPREADDFEMMMRLNYEGIGAVLGDDNGRVVVKKVMNGGSARASGEVAAGDAILAVGKDDGGEMVPVDGWQLHDVVDRIRGPAGTFVRLLLAADGQQPRIVTLERRKTELEDQFAKGEVLTEGDDKIGWIDLPSFYADPEGEHSASHDVRRLLEQFAGQDIRCVVLDLRANGGGLLSEAVDLTGLFLDGGNVVRVVGPHGNTRREDDPDVHAVWSGPLLVLTSRLSASASEIFAGAIQDNGRGLVVGDTTTHGKGTVQAMLDLARYPVARGDHPAGTLKLTIQQFFRPGGDSTQLRGVHADVVLPAWTESIGEGESSSPNALPFRAIAPLVHGPTAQRSPALVDRLAAASAKRVAADPEFVAVEQANAARERIEAAKSIPLQPDAYAAYRAAMKITFVDDDPNREPPYYRREVCRIARDYVALLPARTLAADGAPR